MKQLVSVFVAIAATISVAHAAPPWCGTDKRPDQPDVPGALKRDEPAWPLFAILVAECNTDKGIDEHRGELAAARQYWNKKLDMTDADWADVAVWSTAMQSMRYPGLGTVRLEGDEQKRAWSTLDPIDQYRAIAGSMGQQDYIYLTDAFGTNLSALGRFAFVEQCIDSKEATEVRWAVCQPDIAALDFAKIAAELRVNPSAHNGYQRTMIRMDVLRVRDKLAAHAAAVKALVAKDSAYGKLFDIAAATRKDWAAHVAAREPLLALMAMMDDARITNSRKAYAGCEDKTWAAWKAAVAAIPAKSFKDMRDDVSNANVFLDQALPQIVAEPDGYLASLAYVACHANDADRFAYSLANLVVNVPGFRGPRTATMMAIGSAGIQLDDRNAKLVFPFGDRTGWFRPEMGNKRGYGKGVLASVKPDGKTVHLTFVSKMVKQTQCAQSRETNHITRIDANGTIRYQVVCVRSETVVVNKASDPQTVDARYAAGLKPGAYVSTLGDIVQAVWSKDGAATPSVVLGVEVR